MKDILKVAAVFIGTIVGAGLASGQEILQFFSSYGINGFYGITLCCFIYIAMFIIIIRLCLKHGYKSYRDIIYSVLGKKLGSIINIFITLFIFAGSSIMISGGGAMLNEYAGLSPGVGIFAMCLAVFIVSIFSTDGVITLNSVVVPFSSLTIILLGVLSIMSGRPLPSIDIIPSHNILLRGNWCFATFLYSAFNIMSATGVICPMIYESENKKAFVPGCILGSVVLTLMALLMNYSLLVYFPGSFNAEIPSLYISRNFGRIIPLILTIIVWLEMFSTEIGDAYSLSKHLQYTLDLSYHKCLLIVLGISIPFSFLGFSNLIKALYPPYGAVCLVFILGCIAKFLSLFKK